MEERVYLPKCFHFFLFLLFLLVLCFSEFEVSAFTTVKSLPGFPGYLPFELETGYVGVDESDDVQLFYYFVKSERNPKQDPVLLWLTGGPGCSTLSGFVYEIGPLHFEMVEYNGSLPTLVLNPYSWTKVASIIFVDSPVGTGFSYSRSLEGVQTSDVRACDQAYQFLRKWLIDHQEFMLNPIYIGGDSYSGLIVPLVVLDILKGNEDRNEPFINIKGYLLGNPMTNEMEENMKLPYAHGMGLISDELYESAKRSCGGDYLNINPSNVQCLQDVQSFSECIARINTAHILEPHCNFASPKPLIESVSHRRSLRNYKKFTGPPYPSPAFGCRTYGYLLSYYWANDISVQKALHIREETINEWIRCNYGIPYTRNIKSSFEFHVNLSKRGYRSLIYSGDHDMMVPFLATQAWIRSLNYSIVDDWRPWLVDGQIGGYTRTYSNHMTFATVKGGGHTAPEYQPKECLAMFKRWLSKENL